MIINLIITLDNINSTKKVIIPNFADLLKLKGRKNITLINIPKIINTKKPTIMLNGFLEKSLEFSLRKVLLIKYIAIQISTRKIIKRYFFIFNWFEFNKVTIKNSEK